jgi:hypothetical protein
LFRDHQSTSKFVLHSPDCQCRKNDFFPFWFFTINIVVNF